ncbi:MAG: class I mannose-6-phosphate isomerase [Butyrivibrio sp.]|nr:class I mannose-6-phosphate isomerase [Butyrivibrio sp.]
MAIWKLVPACKDYLWGGRRLVEEYGIKYEGEVCAEAWVLSCHKDGESLIADGELQGKTLSEAIQIYGRKALGKNCEKYDDFPIMIKLIDAKKNLSIQVHPDDEYALKNEGQYGKTEAWFVLDAKEGSYLYKGFEKDISKEEFEERIKNNTLTDVVHKVFVKKGDILMITPGTLHAIGEGILLVEIQQSSNVTYRVYDYGRLGSDGKPRQLNIEKALDVTCFSRNVDIKGSDDHLCSCKFFTVDSIKTSDGAPYQGNADDSSFVSVIAIDGEGEIVCGAEKFAIKKGNSFFITAGSGEFIVSGNLEFILTIANDSSI